MILNFSCRFLLTRKMNLLPTAIEIVAQNMLWDLHWAGWENGLNPQCQHLFDSELVSRLAKLASDFQTEVVAWI